LGFGSEYAAPCVTSRRGRAVINDYALQQHVAFTLIMCFRTSIRRTL